jgi:hypothetical protein
MKIKKKIIKTMTRKVSILFKIQYVTHLSLKLEETS